MFWHLASNANRTKDIADEIASAFEQGHKMLVLTECTEHLDPIGTALASRVSTLLTLHGRMSKISVPSWSARRTPCRRTRRACGLSTGKLIGEGFDHPPLDTLTLGTPISWKGTLQQCAGRLHREHASKTRVRIIDFVDASHPTLLRMWNKRQRGYQARGYRAPATAVNDNLDFDVASVGEVKTGMK